MDMEQWARVRRKVLVNGGSKRSVMSEEGLHWETLQKMLSHSQPPGYRRVKKRGRKIDAHVEWVRRVLESDREVPRKQRHSAKRIFDRLKSEQGYEGGCTAVKELVAEIKVLKQEVFVPLTHRPGEAQVDFGHALVNLNGVLRKCPFFVMSLPYSDAFYVQVFERECTETFWAGHVRAFEFLGAVPTRISYDNSRERKLTDGFLQLQSHYLFAEHFCRVARGNEKGVVEGIVRYSRANFLVPVPQVRTLDELNARLEESCREDRARRLRGKNQTKEALLAEELPVMRKLPSTPFEAARVQATRASNLSLVRFDGNDYSVPVRCAHREVVVKGDCERVRVYRQDETIAEHRRIWKKEQVCFEPVHYLILPVPWKDGNCRRTLGSCAVAWRLITAARARRNTSPSYACWRSTTWGGSSRRWVARWIWAVRARNSSNNISTARTARRACSNLMAGNISRESPCVPPIRLITGLSWEAR